jgi:hypothetical protein
VPERFKVQFTASAEMHDKLRRAQDLLRHQVPDGDLAQVFERALNTLLERLDRQKFAATDRPRTNRGVAPGSRVIPAEVKRAVRKRDADSVRSWQRESTLPGVCWARTSALRRRVARFEARQLLDLVRSSSPMGGGRSG